MSYLDTSYKLGSVQAVQDFTTWLEDGMDNPTQAPPKMAAAVQILKSALQKESSCTRKHKPARVTRNPGAKKSRYGSLKKRLARAKKKK